ncbi:MAG: asparagine synthase [Bacteroidetes bacterium]|nr:asparagine synthase [Bacteroidota bacterium]
MRTRIIPEKQTFAKNSGSSDPDLRAICVFSAIGFFLGKDTYFNDIEALQPATEYEFDENSKIISSGKYWNWHYDPKEINLKQATEEFANLFERIVHEKLNGREIILPLSGGLDSRTQAASLRKEDSVKCYSYKFERSFDETKYGKAICASLGIPFREYIIREGYLWDVIDELSEINQCYADFTHPRQMAHIHEISELGNVFFLGHWGDVLFDSIGVRNDIRFDEQVNVIINKLLKKGGEELAEKLWNMWGLAGKFRDYLDERVSKLLDEIKIDNPGSRIRAFKSTYWAPRWTSANMNVFSHFHETVLPYYDDEMCEFICGIPEEILADRKIQIEYIKMKDPGLAEIPWQTYDPLNLYNYKYFRDISNLPGRIIAKGKKILKENIFNKKEIRSNWEIQFKGEKNDEQLRKRLFGNEEFKLLVNKEITTEFYNKFKNGDSRNYAHPVSMLLTLSQFAKSLQNKTLDIN